MKNLTVRDCILNLGNMDFTLLRKQKRIILNLLSKNGRLTNEEDQTLESMLCLIDKIQDEAVDTYHLPKHRVYTQSRENKEMTLAIHNQIAKM